MNITPTNVPSADDALLAFLQRELPGCEYRVEDDLINGFLIPVQVRGPRIGATSNIDDVVALNKGHLALMAADLVRGIRATAIETYGLAAELNAAKDEARQAGRDEVATEIVNAVNVWRDESGKLPDYLLPAFAWLRLTIHKLPRVDVRSTTDARDLELSDGRARRGAMYDPAGLSY